MNGRGTEDKGRSLIFANAPVIACVYPGIPHSLGQYLQCMRRDLIMDLTHTKQCAYPHNSNTRYYGLTALTRNPTANVNRISKKKIYETLAAKFRTHPQRQPGEMHCSD